MTQKDIADRIEIMYNWLYTELRLNIVFLVCK